MGVGTRVAALAIACALLAASEDDKVGALRAEVDGLRRQLSASGGSQPDKPVQAALNRRGWNENAAITTRDGRLTVGGLVQVWAYSIQNDSLGYADLDQVVPAGGETVVSNELGDNDSFRVRRAQLRFTLDLTRHLRSVVQLDFAREATAFPFFPTNQAAREGGAVSDLSCGCGPTDVPLSSPAFGRHPGRCNRMLEDAYLEYHSFVPHHDFRVGQFRRRLGEEGSRDDGALDFVERAMIAQLGELRDVGVQAHGSWLDERVEYWLGIFDGAGTAFQHRVNRPDDNDAKDIAATVCVRPVRKHETWGTLEAGYSVVAGVGGEAASHTPGTSPINGLNRRETAHSLQYAWLSYFPGGPVKGWWLRGEWGRYRDRFAPSEATSGLDVVSLDPAPFTVSGWNFATGYRLDQSACRERLHRWLRPVEFAFRYDVMENAFFHDLVYPERRFDVFKTQVYTAGLNYHIASNAKLQLNYNWVIEEDDRDLDDRQLREVRNNTLVLSLQVSF
jgi:hypothetical protein